MADEAHQSTAADEPMEEKTASLKKKSGGFFSRFWRGIFGSKNDDYEKKLQYLSKEEAAVHARLKRRARSSRRRARNIIVISVVLEAIAVIYAIVTTRSINLDWKMRATRVFPIFGLPILATLIYSILVHFTRMLDHKDQKMLEKLRAERQAKIDELKERTNYYTTQQIIQRYDLDPAAKAAAATILASKLGADSGLKVYLGDESSYTTRSATGNDVDLVKSRGLRNRKPSHIRSNSTGNPALTQLIDETSVNYSSDDEESPEQHQKVVEHYKGPRANDWGWLSRIAALLVGEDPTQCYALICSSCHMHNGLVRKEDFPYIMYYCPNCHALNGSQHHDDPISGLSSGIDTPKIAAEVNRETADSSNTLAPIYELPTGDENEGHARTSGSSA